MRIDNPDDIRAYYAAVADALIPHLAGRPVTVGTADGSLLGVECIDTADDLDYLLGGVRSPWRRHCPTCSAHR